MDENNKYRKIGEKLMNANIQAPEFDAILSKNALDEAVLRSALASKLSTHQANAPQFDALFDKDLLGVLPVVPPLKNKAKRPISLWWTTASVAAACIAIALLFRSPALKGPADQNKYVQELAFNSEPKTLQTIQFQATPLKIERLDNKIKKDEPIEKQNNLSAANDEVDSTSNSVFEQLTPKNNEFLNVENRTKLSEAYAQVHLIKAKKGSDKITVSASFNGSNRFLSMMNSKSNDGYSLTSIANKARDGYSKLAGASTLHLRASTRSVNDWGEVENITPSMLQNFNTHYDLPINFGLSVSIPLFKNVGLITGLQYTYLANHIRGTDFELTQELHYLGIPLKVALTIIKAKQFSIYTLAGGTLEKGLIGRQSSIVDGQEWKGNQTISGFATSLTSSLGASYDLKKNILLFVEPGIAWYLPTNQPASIRTEEPFQFNLSLGLRYRFQ